MGVNFAVVIGAIFAVIGTVLLCTLVIPEKNRDGLNKFFKFLHDLFNFKYLIIEKVIKVLYIFSTLACICIGFFMLFSGVDYVFTGFKSFALQGLAIMIFGPIVTRIIYELLMMTILAVGNIIEINKKLKDQNDVKQTEVLDNTGEQTKDTSSVSVCTNCGTKLEEGDVFCKNCGTKVE